MNSITQVCIICKIEKPLSEYYTHPKMKNGHLRKCIECCLKQTIQRRLIRLQQPFGIEKERSENRKNYFKYKNRYKDKPYFGGKDKKKIMYHLKYPEKKRAKANSQHLKRKKGNQLHHWSYNEEHWKDVIELTVKDHNKCHRFIIYDQERMMYRRFDTLELLDTREKHEAFIQKMISTKPD